MRLLSIICLSFPLWLLPGCSRVETSTDSTAAASPSRSPVGSPETDRANLDQIRLVFAAYDGPTVNLYTSDTDGSNREVILSENVTGPSFVPAGSAIRVRVSPDRRSLAVSTPGSGYSAVYEMDADGRNKRKLVDRAVDFHWSPDGKKIIYLKNLPPHPPDNPLAGGPIDDPSYEWRLLDLQSAKDDLLTGQQDACGEFRCWTSADYVLFNGTGASANYQSVTVLELATRKLEVHNEWRVLANRTTTVDEHRGLVFAPLRGLKQQGLYELTPEARLGPPVPLTLRDGFMRELSGMEMMK
jgi:dipeptidyl aminopeptidase/acylaminoacyl peptidase